VLFARAWPVACFSKRGLLSLSLLSLTALEIRQILSTGRLSVYGSCFMSPRPSCIHIPYYCSFQFLLLNCESRRSWDLEIEIPSDKAHLPWHIPALPHLLDSLYIIPLLPSYSNHILRLCLFPIANR